MTDLCSNYLVVAPLRNILSKTIATAIYVHLIVIFGPPKKILSDKAPNLIGPALRELNELYGIHRIQTSAYHPAGNGKDEHAHQVLATMLATTLKRQGDWPAGATAAAYALNVSWNPVVKDRPMFLFTGSDPVLPFDALFDETVAPPTPIFTDDDGQPLSHPVTMTRLLHHAFHDLRINRARAAAMQAHYHDRKRRPDPDFKPSDLVLVYAALGSPEDLPSHQRELSRKFFSPWRGPYRVVSKISETTYAIFMQDRSDPDRLMNVNVERLRPYQRRL
jgi:hypothetical protein